MIKSKILDVLKSFSKDELKKFSDYLNSPLFNKRKVISDLYKIYKQSHPEFDDKNLTKERVYKKICGDKEYNDENFRNLNSILLKHAEEFLSFLNYSCDDFTVKKHLLLEINHRNLLTIFEKNFDEAGDVLDSLKQQDLNYFFNEYELFLNKDLYNSIMNKFSKEDIIKSEKNLSAFYIMKVLEIQNYILYNCRISGQDCTLYLKNNFAEKMLRILPEEITELPQIQIYYNALKLEQTNKEEYYEKLKYLLNRFGGLINKDKHYNKYLEMIDYIKRTRTTKDINTVAEIFELRKHIIEKNLLMENTITNMFFFNIVKSGSRLKEFDWIYDFVCKFSGHLIPRYRATVTDLSLAFFYFEKKEFNESLSHAAKVRYEDNFYSLEVKNLTTKIYYETDQYESLINFISSYRMYLSKNRTLSKREFASHIMFLNFLDKMIRIKEQKKYYKLDKLLNDMAGNDFIYDYWLIEKAKELNQEIVMNDD